MKQARSAARPARSGSRVSERPLLQLFFARSVACALPSPACTLLPILSVALAPACLYSLYSPSRLFLLPSLLACTLLPISAVVLTRLSVLCAPSHLLIVPSLACSLLPILSVALASVCLHLISTCGPCFPLLASPRHLSTSVLPLSLYACRGANTNSACPAARKHSTPPCAGPGIDGRVGGTRMDGGSMVDRRWTDGG